VVQRSHQIAGDLTEVLLVLGIVLLQSVIMEFGGHIVIKTMGVKEVSIEIVLFDSLKVALFATHRVYRAILQSLGHHKCSNAAGVVLLRGNLCAIEGNRSAIGGGSGPRYIPAPFKGTSRG
jgi:hypothetical protein